jgi:hypothetical protein
MMWKLNSRTISSYEASSGWLSIMRVRSSFGVDIAHLAATSIVPQGLAIGE